MGIITNAPITPVTYTRVCTDGTSSSGVTDNKSLDRTLYRVFSMQDDMKTLTAPVRIRNEFELFLQYAEKVTDSEVYDSRFDQLDEYLGSLGVVNEVCEG